MFCQLFFTNNNACIIFLFYFIYLSKTTYFQILIDDIFDELGQLFTPFIFGRENWVIGQNWNRPQPYPKEFFFFFCDFSCVVLFIL